jgi:hypothetical protein
MAQTGLMKRFLLLLISIFTISNIHATVWRVHNVSGIDADFNTLSAAVSAANSGDTLYLGTSPQNYGSISLNKKIILIGSGFFLQDNDSTQADKQDVSLTSINFNSGSEGSAIIGLTFTDQININANEIVMLRCRSYYSGTGYNVQISNNISNILIFQSFIHNYQGSSSSSYRCLSLDGNNQNILVSNNVFLRGNSLGTTHAYSIYSPSSSRGVFMNNIVMGQWLTHGSVIQNNILYSGSFSGSANAINNNMADGTQFPAGNGNIQNQPMGSVFLGNGSYDRDSFWFLVTDTITGGAPSTFTQIESIVTTSSGGTVTQNFPLPSNITAASVSGRVRGDHSSGPSSEYGRFFIDGVQIGGNLSHNADNCTFNGIQLPNTNVLANVQGLPSVTLGYFISSAVGFDPGGCGGYSNIELTWTFTAGGGTVFPSAAAGGGVGGTDMGIFGGSRPYVISGMPKIPSIFRANIPSSAETSKPMIYDFSSKSHK